MSYRNLEQWQEIIREQQTSGLSAVAFCKNNNINPKYFSHQKNKLHPEKAAFIKAATAEINLNESISIIHGNTTLKLPASTPTQWITECIKALN